MEIVYGTERCATFGEVPSCLTQNHGGVEAREGRLMVFTNSFSILKL